MLNANTSSPDVYWRIPNANWLAHLEECHKNPDTLKGPDAMLNQFPYPPHYREVRTNGAEKQPEQWRASTTGRNISLHKDKLSLVNLYKTVLPVKYFVS